MVEVVPGFGLGRVLVAKDLSEIAGNHQERTRLGHATITETMDTYGHYIAAGHKH